MKHKSIKKRIRAGISILCLAGILTGCKGKAPEASDQGISDAYITEDGSEDEGAGEETSKEDIQESLLENGESQEDGAGEETENGSGQLENEGESLSGSAALRSGVADWEEQSYQDQYLSYEIPKSWAKSAEQSNDEMRFAFFQSQNPKTQYPSNVNVQITQLNTKDESIDYSSEEIQEEFHQFLLSDMGLPAEAANGTFSVTKTGKGIYVYSLGFDRKTMDNTKAHQTLYLPMNMEHSIVIWATDFKEGAEVSADDVALRICETLEIVK